MVQWKFKNPPINRLRVVALIKQWEENYNLQKAQRNTWTFQCTQNKVYVWLHPPAFSLRNDLNVYSKPCSPQAITVDKASFCCRGSLWWPTDNLSVVWRLWKLEWYMLTCSLSLCFYVTWKKNICRTRRRYPSMSWNFRKTEIMYRFTTSKATQVYPTEWPISHNQKSSAKFPIRQEFRWWFVAIQTSQYTLYT